MIVQPTIGGFVAIIYRRKWLIAVVAALVAGAGAALLIRATPTYQSEAALIVRFGRSVTPTVDLAKTATPSIIEYNARRDLVSANAAILTSPDLASQVITQIGLTNLYPTMDTPRVIGSPMNLAIQRFQASLFVVTDANSDVIRLGFSHPNPAMARNVVSTLVDLYMHRQNAIFSNSSYNFQKTQAEAAQKRLVAAQADLANFKASTGVSDFDNQMSAAIKERSDLGERAQKAQVALGEATERREALTKSLANVPALVATSANRYVQVDDAQARVNSLRAQEREMVATRGKDWPALKELRASLAEAVSATSTLSNASASRNTTQLNLVHQSIQLDLLRATADEQSIRQAVALMAKQQQSLDKEISDLETVRAGLMQREREVSIADAAYRALALKLEESRIGVNRLRDGISSLAVIQQPSLPYTPTFPRYKTFGLLIAIAALLAGVLVALLRELFDDRIITGGQIASNMNIPIIASFDKH